MKKLFWLVVCALLAGVAAADEWKETRKLEETKGRPFKMSVGAAASLTSFGQWTGDFFYNPQRSIGSIGLTAASFKSSRSIHNVFIAVDGYELGIAVGYWSNEQKEDFWGWHGYFSIGLSLIAEHGQNFVFKSPADYKKFGLGLDFYLLRNDSPRPLALTLDGVVTQRNLVLRFANAADAKEERLGFDFRKDAAVQLGLRCWF